MALGVDESGLEAEVTLKGSWRPQSPSRWAIVSPSRLPGRRSG